VVPLYYYFLNNIFDPATLPGVIFYAVLIAIIAWIIGRILAVAVHRSLHRADMKGMDPTSIRFLGELSKVLVYILAFISYARLIPALQSMGDAWLASVSVISLVVGLAMQGTLSNLVAGIALILYRPFRIGDRIQILTPAGPEIGTVESIDLGYTSLCTPDGRRIVLPNSVATTQTNVNFSRGNSHILTEIGVTITDANDVDRARNIFLDAAKSVSKITKVNGCFVTGITAQGTVLTLSVMFADPGDTAQIKSDVLIRTRKELDGAKIKIA
jgi:small conductance mechanosensitive channel